jgi:hypothetical protein
MSTIQDLLAITTPQQLSIYMDQYPTDSQDGLNAAIAFLGKPIEYPTPVQVSLMNGQELYRASFRIIKNLDGTISTKFMNIEHIAHIEPEPTPVA